MKEGNNSESKTKHIWELLKKIPDPEIPAISIVDLGVLRAVDEKDDKFLITITPTYSGCPALKVMEESIKTVLTDNGINNFEIKIAIFPPWTTDWMTSEASDKLRKYGIAPPEMTTEEHLRSLLKGKRTPVTCPYCNSTNTVLTSAFGSTACKALHFCNGCNQPFEEFKCH